MRELKKWLIEPTGVSSMAINGTCAKTGESVVTKDVQLRLDKYRVVTVDGVCYQLCGHIDRDTCRSVNLPLHIVNKFENGVPADWKRIIYGWPRTSPGKETSPVQRPASGGRGSSTTSRPVPGPPANGGRLRGPRESNLSCERAELRSLPRVAPVTEGEPRASQAERGQVSDSHVADTIKENQLHLRKVSVLLERLPNFASSKRDVQLFTDKRMRSPQVPSATVSGERRATRLSTSGQKGRENRKRRSNGARVVAGEASSSKREEDLMSAAKATREDAPVLATKGTAPSEAASCSRMPAPELQSGSIAAAGKATGTAMVTRRQGASFPGLVQLGKSAEARVQAPSLGAPRGVQEAPRSKELNRKRAAEPGASECCKEKKRKGGTAAGSPAAATATTRSSLRMMPGASPPSAGRGHREEEPKQRRGRSLSTAERSRKLRPGKQKGKAASLSSPPRREPRSTRSFGHACTRSGSVSEVREKLNLRSSLNSENSSQKFKDSLVSKLQKEVACPQQCDRAKHVGEQTGMPSPKRLSTNRTESGIHSEGRPLSAEETVERDSSAMQGRRRTQSVISADNILSRGKKGSEAAQVKKRDASRVRTCTGQAQRQTAKGRKARQQPESSASRSSQHLRLPPEGVEPRKTRAQTSQPNRASTSAATRAMTVAAKKGRAATPTVERDILSRGKKGNEAAQVKKRDASRVRTCTGQAQRQTAKGRKARQQPESSASRSSQHLRLPPEGVEPRKTRAQTSQPNRASTSAATRAMTVAAKKGRAATPVRTRKQAGTSRPSLSLKTTGRVLATGARNEAAKERNPYVNERREANEARELPARRCRPAATPRASSKLYQQPGASKTPANISNLIASPGPAATENPDKGQTSQTRDGRHSELTQKRRPSKTRACTVKVGCATEASGTQPLDTLLPQGKVMALGQKRASSLGQTKPNNGAGKRDALTRRGEPQRASKALKPPPSGSDQHRKPTRKEVPRKKASTPGSKTVGTASATEAVQQIAVQRRSSRTTMKNATAKPQSNPQKAGEAHPPLESVDALESKRSGRKLAPAKPGRRSDLGQGSRFAARDQLLATTAQKAIRRQTGVTSGRENAEQAAFRKPGKSRSRKGGKSRKPASPNVKSVRKLAAQAGHTPTGPRKGGRGETAASTGAQGSECAFTPRAGRSRTPAADVSRAPKPSAKTPSTAAPLTITAGKGTKKRKAQVKQLTEALAARGGCDDIYGATGAPVYVAGDTFDNDPWEQMSNLRVSAMSTPTPNSPHVSPAGSCSSVSSNLSATMLVSPLFANAILRGIRGKKAAAPPPSLTPKVPRKKKRLSVNTWAKGLKLLGEKMERDKVRVNCAQSSSEEGSDVESSGSEELLAFLI